MTALQNAIENRIAEACDAADSATAKGDFDTANFNRDLVTEVQSLLFRTGTRTEVIELDKDDAEQIADFIEEHEEAFVDLLLKRRVSLPGRHSLNLMNQLRGR